MTQQSSIELSKQRLLNYIKSNPNCTYRQIKRDTKLKVERYYHSLKDAFKAAGVPFTKNLLKRTQQEQKSQVIDYVRSNPQCSVLDIAKDLNINIERLFGSILNVYNEAKVDYPNRSYIKGVADPNVAKRSQKFENKIINALHRYGKVESKVRLSLKGKIKIVDCLFTLNNVVFVVEIKDYRSKNNITMIEIRQLMNYMSILGLSQGLIICPRGSFPKRKNSCLIKQDGKIIRIISSEDIKSGDVGI